MRAERGFVLLDVMVGVLILCMGVTYLMAISQEARQAVAVSHRQELALNQAQTELEEIKAIGMEAAIAGGRVVPDSTIEKVGADNMKLQVASKWLNSDLLEINIVSGLYSGSDRERVELCTLLSRR